MAVVLLSLPANAASAVDDAQLQLAVTAPAGETTDRAPAPRFQPVGNGDAITSPEQPDDQPGNESSSSANGWWRILLGAAVAAVVLVALVQRRQGPERGRGIGHGPTGSTSRRRNDRNALGH